MSGYASVLLLFAWGVDRMGQRSAEKSAQWRTGNFVYHEGKDAWQCHEDQWLYPAAFDPEKRVIRYVGQHEICGRCPIKDECSPSPGPREITRAVDPWPHSDSGRFHRGISLCIAVIAVFMPAAMLIGFHRPSEVVVLLSAAVVAFVVAFHFGWVLRHTPTNFPMSVPHDTSPAPDEPVGSTAGARPAVVGGVELDQVVDRYATRWRSDRRRVAPSDPTTKE
ncbi:MAG: hypothetical protein L0H79_04130 [Intrasporangium sp.]|uniref:hypothetical protein n=1 Tax=Intrasporangium sp. TaxID=1925024 RepID=UPI0026493108|nr:hypothetical protein [Intrasporangium sp.]MDN5794919.1 hypothetical protein [Intrasporangium sp.]